jgi:hypothetical protein
VSDIRKFSNATGWAPKIGAREGIRKLHDWLIESREVEEVAEASRVNGHSYLPRESEQLSLIRNEHLKRAHDPRSKRLAATNGNNAVQAAAVRHG